MGTIVMTGGTSGLGEIAAKRLLQAPGTRLLLGARRDGPAGAKTLALDMMQLNNIRSFATAIGEQLGTNKIDALVLNAGTQFPNGDTRTPDGFEATFAVNHLAHYLLLRLLLPQLAPGAVVVLTTSGTHDPAERTILPPPRHADACLLAHPDQDPDRDQAPIAAAGRAYASSKLCNLLTARALAAHPEAQARHLTALAYDPGPTPGTGLVRNSGFAVRLIWRTLGTPLHFLIPRFNSREAAGSTLAALALGQIRPPAGHVYAALRRGQLTWANPSELARRDDVMKQLWQDSAALVGVSEETLAESHCKI
jgi:NAD(P)-dependent dehydrogenase (short-subunit alcohol dehydrogenase family)